MTWSLKGNASLFAIKSDAEEHRTRRRNENKAARSLYMIAYLLLLTFYFDVRRK